VSVRKKEERTKEKERKKTTHCNTYFSDVIVAFLEAQARETQRRLSTATVLLRQLHRELVQRLSG
jgi:hypothetical protein